MLKRIFLAIASIAAAVSPALAHHPMGGETPSTFLHGLLSGVGHPVLGLDHLAFVIAVGIASVFMGRRFLAPVIFLGAAAAGTLLHVAAVGLPAVEIVIAISVVAIGFLVMSGRKPGLPVIGALFLVAGLFHGHAYGEAVFGAETTPIIAYLLGFTMIQYAIACASGYVACDLIGRRDGARGEIAPRLAGGMVAGAGCLLVGEHLLAAIGLG